MSHTNHRPKVFVPRVAWIWDDNSDSQQRKKSMLKEADCKIGLSASWRVWNMAESRLDRPFSRERKQAIDLLTHCKCAQEVSRISDT